MSFILIFIVVVASRLGSVASSTRGQRLQER